MSDSGNDLWAFFLVVILTLGILLTAVVAAMLFGRRRLADSLRDYARRLLLVRDQERALVASEVHAEFAQRLVVLRNEMSQWRARAHPATPAEILRTEEALVKLGDDLRNLAHRLHPSNVKKLGLLVALTGLQDELKQTHGLTVHLHHDGHPLPRNDLGHALYRIIQEALLNVVRHAGVAEATVSLISAEGRVQVEIRDEGAGFDQSTDRGRGLLGLGLISIQERVALAGGRVQIRTRVREGTIVWAEVPWEGS